MYHTKPLCLVPKYLWWRWSVETKKLGG